MDEWTLSDEVLKSYIEGFYGHGSYQAKCWFIGMEFGGGNSVAEIVSRIQGWHKRGAKELEDLVGPGGGGSRWFPGSIPLQPTWARLIRILLSSEGSRPTKEQVRAYQRDKLGREGGHDCILELFPLPSPGIGKWLFYGQHSKLPYLSDRESYMSHVAPLRIAHLRNKIAEYRPTAVVFYGSGFAHWWREISNADFLPATVAGVLAARTPETLYLITKHPTAHGAKNDYFDAVGRLIAAAEDNE